ncbi:MAG: host attachment protein [Hyphomonadaceae bacterium]
MHGEGCTWIVTADGGRARVLEERRRGVALAERAAFAHDRDADAAPRDRPARVQESAGPARHAVEPRIAPHEAGERAFLQRLAAFLDDGAAKGAYEELVLFAPPRALGVLRNALSGPARGRIAGEAALDVTRETPEAVAARLAHLRHGA